MIINNKILLIFKMHLQTPLFYNSILLFILFHHLTYTIYKSLKIYIFLHHQENYLVFFSIYYLTRFTPTIHIPKIASTAKFSEAYLDKDQLNTKAVYVVKL